MSLIRTLRPERYKPTLAKLANEQTSQDGRIEKAKLSNMRRLGRQTLKTDQGSTNLNSACGSLLVGHPEPNKPVKPEPENKTDQDPHEVLFRRENDFLQTFKSLDENSATVLARRWGAANREILRNGGEPDEMPTLAALSYNHAKKILRGKSPGAPLSELREASKSDQEVSRLLALMENSSSYLRTTRELPSSNEAPGEPEPVRSPERQKLLAQMAAENQQTFLRISQLFTELAAERTKTAAQLHSLEATTAQQISDLMMKSHLSRVKSSNKGHQHMVYLLSDNWPKA
jgi:hypothetical protein